MADLKSKDLRLLRVDGKTGDILVCLMKDGSFQYVQPNEKCTAFVPAGELTPEDKGRRVVSVAEATVKKALKICAGRPAKANVSGKFVRMPCTLKSASPALA